MLTAAGRAEPVRGGQAGVDAVAGAHERLLGGQVGRREAELAPAVVAVQTVPRSWKVLPSSRLAWRQLAGRDAARGCGSRRRSRRRPRAAGARPSSKRPSARSSSRVALARRPEAEVLADRHLPRAERADQHVVDELLGRPGRERRVEGDHDQLLRRRARRPVRPCARAASAAAGVCSGATTDDRVGLEGQHRVGAGDHLAVAEVDAVEGADRDAAPSARARRRAERVTFTSAAKPIAWEPAPARSSATVERDHAAGRSQARAPRRRPARPLPLRTARSRAPQLQAVGVAAGRRSASARRCPRSTRSKAQPGAAPRRRRPAPELAGSACTVTIALGHLEAPRRGARGGRRARRRS